MISTPAFTIPSGVVYIRRKRNTGHWRHDWLDNDECPVISTAWGNADAYWSVISYAYALTDFLLALNPGMHLPFSFSFSCVPIRVFSDAFCCIEKFGLNCADGWQPPHRGVTIYNIWLLAEQLTVHCITDTSLMSLVGQLLGCHVVSEVAHLRQPPNHLIIRHHIPWE